MDADGMALSVSANLSRAAMDCHGRTGGRLHTDADHISHLSKSDPARHYYSHDGLNEDSRDPLAVHVHDIQIGLGVGDRQL